MNGERSWAGRLLSAAFTVLVAALALYWAASLIKAVWLTLLIGALAVACLVAGIGWYRRRRSDW